MKLLLLPNIDKPHVRSCISRLTGMQFSQPVEFLMENRLAVQFGKVPGLRFGALSELIKECDVCIAVGETGRSSTAERLPPVTTGRYWESIWGIWDFWRRWKVTSWNRSVGC